MHTTPTTRMQVLFLYLLFIVHLWAKYEPRFHCPRSPFRPSPVCNLIMVKERGVSVSGNSFSMIDLAYPPFTKAFLFVPRKTEEIETRTWGHGHSVIVTVIVNSKRKKRDTQISICTATCHCTFPFQPPKAALPPPFPPLSGFDSFPRYSRSLTTRILLVRRSKLFAFVSLLPK